jgi:hypothetical protein
MLDQQDRFARRVATSFRQRAHLAAGRIALADRLAVLLEEEMSFLHDPHIGREVLGCRTCAGVGLRVRGFLSSEAKPDEDAQSVGFWRKKRMTTGEQKDFFCARFPNARKMTEHPFRRVQRYSDGRGQITVKFLDRNACTLAQLVREGALENASSSDLLESLLPSCQNRGRSCSHRVFELLERLTSSRGRSQVGHVLQKNQLEGSVVGSSAGGP